jgi:hypothetical protein
MIFLLVLRLESLQVTAFAGAAGFDPDDVLFLVGPIAWLDGLTWLLLAAAVGAPVFLLLALLRSRHVLADQRSRRTL